MSTLPRAGELALSAQIAHGGTAIAACGVFPSIDVVLAWAGGSAGGDVKRGAPLAMMGVSNLGGICSSFIYRTVDSPQFHTCHGTVIGCVIISYPAFVWAVVREKEGEADASGQVLCVARYDIYISAVQ